MAAQVPLVPGARNVQRRAEPALVRLPVRVRHHSRQARAGLAAAPLALLWVRKSREHLQRQDASRGRALQERPSAGVSHLEQHADQMPQPEQSVLFRLWRAWHHRLREVEEVRELPDRHGAVSSRQDTGAPRQQWELRTRELSVGDPRRTDEQHTPFELHRSAWQAADVGTLGAGTWSATATPAEPTTPRLV